MGKLALKINKGTWEKAREKFKEGYDEDVELEPGRYDGNIEKVDIIDSDKGQQAVFRIKIPDAINGKPGIISIWFVLEDEERTVWLLRFLEKLGYDPRELDPTDLSPLFEEIASKKPEVRIRAKNKNGYMNYSVDQVLSSGDAAPAAAVEEEVVAPPPETKKTPGKPAAATTGKTTKKAEPPPEPADEEVVVEEEAPAAEEETVDLKVGLKMKATVQGELQDVTITELHEKEEKVTVKTKAGKLFKVPLTKLAMPE